MDKGVPFGPGCHAPHRAAKASLPSGFPSLTLIFRLHNAEFHSI